MPERTVPLVSVIISFLNEEEFLADAIESVIAQSYTNWEIIAVDDGSKDNSTAIAKKYAESYPDKIRYTHHKNHGNLGLSYSRNHGIAISKGELIAILDADDVWLPDKLKLQVALLLLNPKAGMLCEASEYWYYKWHDQEARDITVQIGRERDKLFEPLELVFQLYPLSDGPAPCPSGIMMHKNVVLKHGGFESHFSGKYQLYEDQAFLHKIYLNEYVYISSLCNHRYRQRVSSLVYKINKEGYYDSVRKYFLEWLTMYMKRHNFNQKELKKLVRKAMNPYRKTLKRQLKKRVKYIYHRFRHFVAASHLFKH